MLSVFVKALGMCVSEGSSSTDTSRSFTLLMLRDSFRLRSKGNLFDGLDSDLSLVETGDALRFCSVFEADSSGES